eukprot:749581-Hanusia_phi.AAC.4
MRRGREDQREAGYDEKHVEEEKEGAAEVHAQAETGIARSRQRIDSLASRWQMTCGSDIVQGTCDEIGNGKRGETCDRTQSFILFLIREEAENGIDVKLIFAMTGVNTIVA